MTTYFVPGRCPDCGTSTGAAPRCPSCGLVLTGPVADDLRLTLQRADYVLHALRAFSAAPATRPAPPPQPSASVPEDAHRHRRWLPAVSVPVVLLGLGSICVLVAAIVFVAVTWTDLSLGWRTTILLAITALATWAASWAGRRGLRGAAEALTLVSSGLLLIDLLAGNDAGLPVLSSLHGTAFEWLVALVMLATGAAWVLWAQRTDTHSLVGQQAVVVLAALAMVRLAALGWDYDAGWLAAAVAAGTAVLALALWRLRVTLAAAALGVLAVSAWTYLTALGLIRAVLAEGPRQLFLGLDGGPLLASGLLAAVVASAPRPPAAVRSAGAVFAVGAPVVVVLLPARELDTTAAALLVAVAALVLAAGRLVAPVPWRHGLRVVGAATAVVPAYLLALGALVALARVVESASTAWTRRLQDTLAFVEGAPDVAVWSFVPLGALVAAAGVTAAVATHTRRRTLVFAAAGAGAGAVTSVLSTSWPLWLSSALLAVSATAGVAVLGRTRSRAVLGVVAGLVTLGIGVALASVAASALFLAGYGGLLAVAAWLLRGTRRAVLVALAVALAAVALEAGADLADLTLPVTGLLLAAAAAAALLSAQWLAGHEDGAAWRHGLEAVALPLAVVAAVQTLDDVLVRTVAVGGAAAVTAAVASLVRDRRPLACLSSVLLAATAHQVVQLAGGSFAWRAVAVAAVAGLTAVAAQRLRRPAETGAETRPGWAGLRVGLEVTAALLGMVAVAAQQPESLALTVGLTVLGVSAVLVALLSSDRRWGAWLGSGLLVLASWVRLSALEVDVVEAYTVPGALALLVAALVRMRRDPAATSWRGLATSLTLGLGPSLAVALEEPTTLRALLVGIVGLALVGAGARLGWGAPLLVGGVALGLLALVNIAPYAAALPRWVLFGTAGVALLGLGVTWERRRQDLHLVHRYAARLR